MAIFASDPRYRARKDDKGLWEVTFHGTFIGAVATIQDATRLVEEQIAARQKWNSEDDDPDRLGFHR